MLSIPCRATCATVAISGNGCTLTCCSRRTSTHSSFSRVRAPFDDGNPYNNNPIRSASALLVDHTSRHSCVKYQRALKAVWFQKWFVHRRLRPEVMAERVDRTLFAGWLSGACGDTQLVQRFKSSEGLHAGGQCTVADGVSGRLADASGGAGHATVAGACVTIQKRGSRKRRDSSTSVSIHCNPQMMA